MAEATDTTPASDDAAMLKQYLGSRDVPCPHCNYNLRNLTSNVCPECGEEVTLRVQSLEPRQAAPIAGLVLLSAGAGLNGLLLIYWLTMVLYYDRSSGGWGSFFKVNAVGFVALGSCVAIWLKFWRKIRRLATLQRWLAVIICALVTTTDLVCFIKFIR